MSCNNVHSVQEQDSLNLNFLTHFISYNHSFSTYMLCYKGNQMELSFSLSKFLHSWVRHLPFWHGLWCMRLYSDIGAPEVSCDICNLGALATFDYFSKHVFSATKSRLIQYLSCTWLLNHAWDSLSNACKSLPRTSSLSLIPIRRFERLNSGP